MPQAHFHNTLLATELIQLWISTVLTGLFHNSSCMQMVLILSHTFTFFHAFTLKFSLVSCCLDHAETL